MTDRVALAKFIEAGIATGRSPIACLQMLDAEELDAVIADFLKLNGSQFTVRVNLEEAGWALTNRKIECIKRVREIADCSLLAAKNFVEGTGELVVNAQQKDYLLRTFANALIID